MPYSQFNTLAKALKAFDLSVQEQPFLPDVSPTTPSDILQGFLNETLPAAASGTEKVRSEGIIYPVLIEVRKFLERQVSVFSGEDFTVDESQGLNGIVDFLVSRSPILSTIQTPVAVIVEAKRRFLKLEGKMVTIDLTDYPLPPVDQIFSFLIWMLKEG